METINDELFRPSVAMSSERERIARLHHSAFYDGWIRLRKNKAAVTSCAVLLIVIILAVFAPIFSNYKYFEMVFKKHCGLTPKEYKKIDKT
jgi:oligopeptide transport system permease protein